MKPVQLLLALALGALHLAVGAWHYDPEETMNAIQLIQHWGYTGIQYNVITSDGYVLEIQRIPYGKSGPGSAFIFADAGFDVWLGNFRGNTYGLNNIYLSNKDHEFWEFSYDEMAKYDLEAMITFALQTSGVSQLYYMGHSEGTMTAFAKFSTDPDFGNKIIKYFALAPVANVQHIGGAFAFLAPFTKTIERFADLVGYNDFLPNNWFMDLIAKFVCGFQITDKLLCSNLLFLIAGPNSHQLNQTRVPVYVAHTPAGTSTQNVVHFGQNVNSGKFQMYDYGSKAKNNAKYGQPTPPLYDITKMNVPTAIFWGDNDVLADPQDVRNGVIPNIKGFSINYIT